MFAIDTYKMVFVNSRSHGTTKRKRRYEKADSYFKTVTSFLLAVEDQSLEHLVNSAFQKMFASFDQFIRQGSSWVLKKVAHLDIYTVAYNPLGGGSYFKLPPKLRNTKAIVNVKNT